MHERRASPARFVPGNNHSHRVAASGHGESAWNRFLRRQPGVLRSLSRFHFKMEETRRPSVVTKRMTCIRLMWGRRVGLGVCLSSSERGRPTILVLEICRTTNPITQLSDAKSPLMALHVPELRMMMPANESSADIPYWNQWPLPSE